MRKGIRCNETRFTNGEDRNRIRYEFVTEDGVTASGCVVRLGDTDPLTGEPLTDLTFFREYYRVVDHEVHQNLKAARPSYTPEERARREQEKQAFVSAFVRRWGYAPSKDDVLFHLDQLERERYVLSLDSFVDGETGDDMLDHCPAVSTSREEPEESPEMQALREVAESLTGRKAEVYEAMIQRAAGGKARLRFGEIARKWGVAQAQISKDQQRIMEMVRRRAERLRLENDE